MPTLLESTDRNQRLRVFRRATCMAGLARSYLDQILLRVVFQRVLPRHSRTPDLPLYMLRISAVLDISAGTRMQALCVQNQ